MEVSSHALVLDRIAGIEFGAAVFTNLTQDHLDFHGTMEAYFEAKALLFRRLPPAAVAVLNADDRHSARLRPLTRARVVTFGQSEKADVRLETVGASLAGTEIPGRTPPAWRSAPPFSAARTPSTWPRRQPRPWGSASPATR